MGISPRGVKPPVGSDLTRLSHYSEKRENYTIKKTHKIAKKSSNKNVIGFNYFVLNILYQAFSSDLTIVSKK